MISETVAVTCETYRVFVRDYRKFDRILHQLRHIHPTIDIYSFHTD
jgi:hypothetical protein